MYTDDSSDEIERVKRSLQALNDINFSVNHPNFAKRVILKKPQYVPLWLCRLFNQNFGKEGVVIFVEIDEIFKVLAYDVVFDAGPNCTMGRYFEPSLDFHLPDMLTEKERQIPGLDALKE